MASSTPKRRRAGRGGFVRPADSEASLDTTVATQDSLGATFSTWRTNSQVHYHSQTLTVSQTSSLSSSNPSSSAPSSCSVCAENVSASADVSLSVFCSLPTEILEAIFGFLPVVDRIHFFQVLSLGKHLKMKARRALSSTSIWRRVNLLARRPDHLVTRSADCGELVFPSSGSFPTLLREQILRFFPPVVPTSSDETGTASRTDISPIDLKFVVLKKHSFELPFDFLLESLITRGACEAIRSLTFAVEEIWHPEFYPLQRSDAALDRVTQLIEQLGPNCREINVVKWPRLQDDTVIDQTYSEMQAHYASADSSTTDPILSLINNVHVFANLRVLGLFWFDFEDPEFWAVARSNWCLTSHQWVWSEEEFCSGHTLYPTQASREFNVVDNLTDLEELRLTFSSYSDDRYFLDPVFSPIVDLLRLKIMIRASWNGWDGLNAGISPLGAYWNTLEGKVPRLRVTLTFIEFFDCGKFDDWRRLFHPKIPVSCCQWIPGAVVTLFALRCLTQSYGDTLTQLDIHSELVDSDSRNDLLSLLSDTIQILRSLTSLTRFIFDSTVTFHFCKVVVRLRKANWNQLVFFRDRLLEWTAGVDETSKVQSPDETLSAFEDGVSSVLRRRWTFHDARDREYGPRGYKG